MTVDGEGSKMTKTKTSEYDLIPPDGGWGWMVVLGVAINNVTSQSLTSVFSLLFGDKLVSMGHKTTSAAVIINTLMAIMNFSGLLTGPLLKTTSLRKVAFTGGCFVVTGLILTSFANSIIHITITYSVLVGLGMGLFNPSSFLAVRTYFQESRGRAVGLSMAGGNFGQMAMPHLVRILLETYGFSGALLVLGGVAMHGPLGSLLFHPLKWHAERKPVQQELKLLKDTPASGGECDTSDEAGLRRRSKRYASMASLASSEMGDMSEVVSDSLWTRLPPEDVENKDTHQGKSESLWRRAVAFLDLDLLRSGVYLNVTLGTSVMKAAAVNYALLLPFYLQRHVGLSLADTALCLTAQAAGDFLSRLTVPPFMDHIKASPRKAFFIGSVFTAITRSAIAMTWSLVPLCAWCVLQGFSRGAAIVYSNLSVAHVCPERQLPAAVGLNMVFGGLSLLLVGPVLGHIRDKTGDYPFCMHLLTALLLFAMLCWLVEGIIHWYRQKR